MDCQKFEKIVKEGIKAIPKKFLKKLNNVSLCIEEEPNPEQLRKLKARPSQETSGFLIFGLYEGVPQTKRRYYGQVLPDKITIFKKPIEMVARSEEEIKEIVKNTVWHEIAHHFGMDEQRVREAEQQRRRK